MQDDMILDAFCCSCGGTVDCEEALAFLDRQAGVRTVQTHRALCLPEGLDWMTDLLDRSRPDGVVVAACSSLTREDRWQRLMRDAGLNPYRLAISDIKDTADSTAGLASLAMAVARVRRMEPVPVDTEVPMVQRVLIIGSGAAGLRCALQLSEEGIDAVIVDEEDMGDQAARHAEAIAYADEICRMSEEVSENGGIEILAPARIRRVDGQVGDFSVHLEDEGAQQSLKVGAIIVATGAESIFPERLYGVGPGPNVTVGSRLTASLSRIEGTSLEGGRPLRVVFLVHEDHEQSPLPFVAAMKAALQLKRRMKSRVYLLFCNAKVSEHGLEQLYGEVRRKGVQLARYEDSDGISIEEIPVPEEYRPASDAPPALKVVFTGEWLESEGIVSSTGEKVVDCDLLVVSEEVRPSGKTQRAAALLSLGRGPGGFIAEDSVFLLPTLTSRRGVFAVGGCTGPRTYCQTTADALDAASQAALLVSHDTLRVDWNAAVVDTEKCALCLTCVRTCPHAAIDIDEERNAVRISQEACHSCGTCASECPAEAIQLQWYTDDSILSALQALGEVQA